MCLTYLIEERKAVTKRIPKKLLVEKIQNCQQEVETVIEIIAEVNEM